MLRVHSAWPPGVRWTTFNGILGISTDSEGWRRSERDPGVTVGHQPVQPPTRDLALKKSGDQKSRGNTFPIKLHVI